MLALPAIRSLLSAATPGPWRVDDSEPGDIVIWGPTDEDRFVATVGDGVDTDAADAALIVALRNEAPALLVEVERLRALDDPDFDGTDAAHPAWWRGEASGALGVVAALTALLDHGRHVGTFASGDVESLAMRLEGMLREAERLTAQASASLALAEQFQAQVIEATAKVRGLELLLREATAALSEIAELVPTPEGSSGTGWDRLLKAAGIARQGLVTCGALAAPEAKGG